MGGVVVPVASEADERYGKSRPSHGVATYAVYPHPMNRRLCGLLCIAVVLTVGAQALAQVNPTCVEIDAGPVPTQVAVGTPVTVNGDCCEVPSVPALPPSMLMIAGLLLLGLAFATRGKSVRLGSSMLGLFLLSAGLMASAPRTAFSVTGCGSGCATSCSGSLNWEATSGAQTVTGSGASFTFTPNVVGTFTISASAGGLSDSTTIDVVLQNTGLACSTGGQCITGFCADGVCCQTSCAGTCERCAGGTGACSIVYSDNWQTTDWFPESCDALCTQTRIVTCSGQCCDPATQPFSVRGCTPPPPIQCL